jgi:hypothetical protein
MALVVVFENNLEDVVYSKNGSRTCIQMVVQVWRRIVYGVVVVLLLLLAHHHHRSDIRKMSQRGSDAIAAGNES